MIWNPGLYCIVGKKQAMCCDSDITTNSGLLQIEVCAEGLGGEAHEWRTSRADKPLLCVNAAYNCLE